MPSKRLFKIVQIMCLDNNIPLIKLEMWPCDAGFDYSKLNKQVDMLSDEEMDLFTTGESREMFSIEKKYNISLLADFLNAVFDGDISYKFMADSKENIWKQKMAFVGNQTRQMMDKIKPFVRCECQKKLKPINAFRCLYCGQWYCKECAEVHFGKTVSQYRVENPITDKEQ